MSGDDPATMVTGRRPARAAGGVLVTGGSGYLGTLAIEALVAAGVDGIVSVDIRAPQHLPDGVTAVTGDLRELDLPALLHTHDVVAVVHLAAIVNPPPGMDEAELHDIEVGGTRRVLDACLAHGVQHLTVASSGAAYGYRPANRERPLVESDPVPGHERFAYSRHKAEVEAMLAAAREDHPALRQLVLRPGTILGAGTDNQITALFTAPVVLGLRDTDVPFVFVHDRDVAQVIALGVRERRTGTFNLAGDGVLTLRDIAALEGRRFVRLPAGAIAAALRTAGRVIDLPYGPEQVDFLRYRPVLDGAAGADAFPELDLLPTTVCYARFRGAARADRAPGGGHALLTGAAGNVGRATLRLLTAAGYDTIGVDHPSMASPRLPPGARLERHLGIDLADPSAAEQLTEALAAVDRLELVVVGAGVTALGSLEDTDDATFRRVMDVNYHGALRTARAALPALRAAGGQLIVISSVAGLLPVPGRPAYVGAKHALTGAFRALAGELGRQGVAVTVVHPTFLRTEVADVSGADRDLPHARTVTGTPLDADDVARAILRLHARHRAGRRVPVRVQLGRTARLADVGHRLAPDAAVRAAARRLAP